MTPGKCRPTFLALQSQLGKLYVSPISWVMTGIGFQAILLYKRYMKICWLECMFFHTVKKGINSTLSLCVFPDCLSYSQFSIAQLWHQIAKQVSDRVYPVKERERLSQSFISILMTYEHYHFIWCIYKPATRSLEHNTVLLKAHKETAELNFSE